MTARRCQLPTLIRGTGMAHKARKPHPPAKIADTRLWCFFTALPKTTLSLCAQIAQSLRSNGNLRLLDISFNNMKPRSAMVLANALLDNS